MTTEMRNKSTNLLLAGLSGALGVLSFPPFRLGFLAWVSLIPLLFVAKNAGYKRAFWYAYLSGIVFFGGLLYWLVNVTVPGAIVLVFGLAIFYGLFGILARHVFKNSVEPLILPFVWVVLEYIRAHIFTGFPWGLMGYTQYTNIDLIQIADITGVYGVSFILVLFNVAIFGHIVRDRRRVLHLAGALILILAALTYSKYKLDNCLSWGSPRIAVVQGNIPQESKWEAEHADEIIRTYSDLTRDVSGDRPDMVIWPETAYPYLITALNDADEIETLASETGVPILAGAVSKDGPDYFNSAIFFTGDGKEPGKYNKTHLVPFGEYIPAEECLFSIRKYINKPIGNFAAGSGRPLFSLRSSIALIRPDGTVTRATNFYKFGVMICFEDIFPYIARDLTLKGANLLVNITNDAWFGDTAAPEQHVQASVFRAVENRVSVVRAANTGVSCFVDFTGRVLFRICRGGKDTFIRAAEIGSVRVSNTGSFYTENGDLFVFFCIFMVMFILAIEFILSRSAAKRDNTQDAKRETQNDNTQDAKRHDARRRAS